MKKKKLIIILVIVVIIVMGVFFGSNYLQQKAKVDQLARFQTAAIERGDLETIIGATGTVHAEQSTTLAWQTSGRIGEINVALDDHVEKGDILASLDNSSLPQSIILAESDLISAQKALENLINSELAQEQAYQAYVTALDKLEKATKGRENLNHPRSNKNTIELARSDYILAQDNVKKLEKDYDNYFSILSEDDTNRAVFMSSLATARKQRDSALSKLNWLLSKPDTIEIEKADAELNVAQATLEDATREWERFKNGVDPRDIAAAKARVAAIEATLKLAQLEAPFLGTITATSSKVGDQVSAGTVSFRIDDLSRLLVDMDITEVDINRINVGQPVTISFDAILDKEFNGLVTEVGRVGTVTQGIVNFKVTIEITNPDESVRPGMTAAINIITSQLKNVLLVPNRAVRYLDGQRVIYLLKDGIQQSVEIKIGASSETNSEIVSGDVKEGDLVILNPSIEMNIMMDM